jgi:hypothetical protein
VLSCRNGSEVREEVLIPECGVTANILDLGSSDSGFESLHSDQQMSFTRTIEDFTCEHCSFEVKGSGYTNHCPKCLWSKHVDINPGDRAEKCKGMMKPISYQKMGVKERIILQCQRCGFEKPNKIEREDDREALLMLG